MGDSWVVVGATGLVGGALTTLLRERGVPVTGLVRRRPAGLPPGPVVQADLSDAAATGRVVASLRPAVVAYCAGATAVDRCESDPSWARALNVTAVEAISRQVSDDTVVVYLSTDYVFDGEAGPYGEDDPPAPINEYGRSKLAGEAVVRRRAAHLVVRTTVVYGWEPLRHPVGTLSRLAAAGARGEPVACPVDEVGTPTAAPDLARAVADLVGHGASGVHHATGPDRVDRLTFCRAALVALGFDPGLAHPVRSAELGRPARRPLSHGLTCDRTTALLGRGLLGIDAGLRGLTAGTAPVAARQPASAR